MPTPEASASSSVALRNANITELAVEEADYSFKANVSIMTQDQCVDNGHQANSNNRSSSDKVSDDLNSSKNSVVSNGVNSVQEFNVDVNREYSTDLVIVQNSSVDAVSPPTGKVLPTSKQLTETPSKLVGSKDKNLDNSINNNINANTSECANNIVADMTVITHQNSSENIREIIANSEKANKNSSDSQFDRMGKSLKSDINLRNANNSAGTRKNRKLIRSENVNECEDDQIEDPIERLNKLRASISSALSEVKGVLKQYSTEQSCDDQNESAPSKQPPDDGPVRFRFVRKIRRRSVFSEDDETEIPKTSTDAVISAIIENKVVEDVPNEFQNIQKILSNENQDLTNQNKDGNTIPQNFGEVEMDKKPMQTIKTEGFSDIQIPQDISDNVNTTVNEIQKTSIADIEVPPISTTSEVPKIKSVKTKKVLKKVRRASIAAVEINQISNDQPQIPLELKTQRRPSDSGTLVKQTTRIKSSKTSEKPKLISNRKAKTGSSSSKTESSTINSSKTLNAVEKTVETLSPTEDVKTDTVLIDNQIKPTATVVPTSNVIPLESTQNTTSPAIEESNTIEKTRVPAKAILPMIPEANTPAGTSVAKSSTPEVTPALAVSSKVNADVSKSASKETEVETSPKTSIVKLNTPEVVSGPAATLTVITDKPKTSPIVTEVSTSPATISIIKFNTPEVTPAPSAVSTKVKDDLSQSKSEMAVTPEKSNISEAPIHSSQQSLGTNTEVAKVGIPNQLITKSTQLPQSSKPGIMSKTSNTSPELSNKIPVTSPATAKVEASKSITDQTKVLETKTVSTLPIQVNKQTKMSSTAEQIKVSKVSEKVAANKQTDVTSGIEPDVPKPSNVPKDAVAVKLNLPGQESVEELQRLEEDQDKEPSPPQTPETTATAPPKKKRKAKRKVVIRRIKRKLSKDDTFLHPQETASELEIEEKEIEEKDVNEEPEEEGPKQPKSCLKNRQFEIGDVVMYAEHYKKTQVRWKKAVVTERITSISYKLNIEGGDERPAHISYIKKFTDRKVNFGGKEYLEIDYAQIEEEEEKERNYSIWNLV